jgi:spore coat protein A
MESRISLGTNRMVRLESAPFKVRLQRGESLGMNRRELLRMGLYTSAGLFAAHKPLLGWNSAKNPASGTQAGGLADPAQNAQKPVDLAKYVDPLPTPAVIRSLRRDQVVHVKMHPFRHRVHRDLPPTSLWGYNGSWPGPTFEVRKGQPLSVRWTNGLPTKHFLPIDKSIHGAEESVPQVRTVVHVHGAQVLPEHDGYPDAWVTSDGKTGSVAAAAVSHYPNDQRATTLWYHDHAIGATRLNIYAGLAGFYLIRDQEEEALNLPSGEFEIPLMIQDRSFNADGSLLYPAAQNGTHPVWIQEFFGNTICVNGKATPFLEVEPRKYRFRMVNASNSRFYHLTLVPTDDTGKPAGKPGDAPAFHQVGTDGGLLPAPVSLHYLIMAPGERFDVVVDFSEHRGASIAMLNDAPAPYTRGGEVVPADVILFKVTKPLSGKDTSSLPETLVPMAMLDPAEAVQERVLALTEMDRSSDGYTMIGLLGQKHWDDPITEDPKAGSTEIWSFANTTGDVHPIHLHLVQFQVINRQPFDTRAYLQTGKLVTTGRPMPPERNERPGWKDTVKTYPGYVTRVITKFDLPAGTAISPGQEFRYVWHCHILEHEDNEMMRPYKIVG